MSDFVKFVGKYAGEMRAASGLFAMLFRALPLDPQDKRRAVETIDALAAGADRIEAGLSKVLADGQINRDDLKIVLREVVAELLPDMIGGKAEATARVRAPRARKARSLPKADA